MRVAFLTNIVSPYRRPVFEQLKATDGWTFRLFVNAISEFDRAWQVDTSQLDIVRSRSIGVRRPVFSMRPKPFIQMITLHVPLGLWRDLRRFRPEAIVSHELGPRSLLAALYAWVYEVPLVLWAYQSRISGSQGRSRDFMRRWLLRRADRVVGMGRQAREVLQGWGVPPDRIIDTPNSPDSHAIRDILNRKSTQQEALVVRRKLAGGRRVALVVGRLIPLKGVQELLAAWSRLDSAIRDRWCLTFVGSGPLAEAVDSYADANVVRVGEVPAEKMPIWYRASDLHVFPTLGDVWGLVVNEAMACGVPTLCSDQAGCYDDVIEDGVNGLTFDPTSPDEGLVRALTHEDLPRLGRCAAAESTQFTPERMAASFRTAVSQASAGFHTDRRPHAEGEQL